MFTPCVMLRPLDIRFGSFRFFFSRPLDIRTAYGHLTAKKLCEEGQERVSEIQILECFKESLPPNMTSYQGPRRLVVPQPSPTVKPIPPVRVQSSLPREEREWTKTASYNIENKANHPETLSRDREEDRFQETQNILEETSEKMEMSKTKENEASSELDEVKSIKESSNITESSTKKMKTKTTQDLVPSERIQNVEFHSSAQNASIPHRSRDKPIKTKSALESLCKQDKNIQNFDSDEEILLLKPEQVPQTQTPVSSETPASTKRDPKKSRHDYFRETNIIPTLNQRQTSSSYLEFKKNHSKKLTAKRTFYVQIPPSKISKVVKRKITVQAKSKSTRSLKPSDESKDLRASKPRLYRARNKFKNCGTANLCTQSVPSKSDTTEEVLERIFQRSNKLR